jgi:PTH1 family peptidyl-tRNA hydrolase
MAKAPRIVVGLGNPGDTYAHTRHNIGAAIITRIAEKRKGALGESRAPALVYETTLRARPVVLAFPQTYMNRSGEAARALLRIYGAQPSDLLIVYDDIHLPLGHLRLRPGGSAGGHNGLADIIEHLKTDQVARLRVGVGSVFAPGKQADYVLSPFEGEEITLMEDASDRAMKAIETVVVHGLNRAMNDLNTQEKARRADHPVESGQASQGLRVDGSNNQLSN